MEARLEPAGNSPSNSKARAKIERKDYGDGNRRLKVSISDFDGPDGEQVDLIIDNEIIGRTQINSGKAKMDLRSENGNYIPEIFLNDTAEICYKGEAIVRGLFCAD